MASDIEDTDKLVEQLGKGEGDGIDLNDTLADWAKGSQR